MKPFPELQLNLPKRLPLRHLMPFLGVVLVLQLLEGTKAATSLEFCAFILLMTDAFNAVGGMVYPSGAYIFFLGMLSVILGGLAKTALGESLDAQVMHAQRSMLVYLVGAVSVWCAARISARVRVKRPWLESLNISTQQMREAALGSALVGQFGWMLVPLSVVSTFNQLNQFLPIAILFAVYTKARATHGRRTFSVLAFVVWLWGTVNWGIFLFSKAGMFTPAVMWALAALAAGYRSTWKKLLTIGAVVLVCSSFMTAISQVGRVYRDSPDAMAKAIDLTLHPVRTREIYLAQSRAVLRNPTNYHWFSDSQGLLDRLTVFPIDDALISISDEGHTRGILPIETYVVNMIPRYLVKQKLTYHWGNQYAHEIGMLGNNDDTTGVSFSPFADGYHTMLWWGMTAVMFPVLLAMFSFCDSLTGSTEQTIWACLYLLYFAHGSAEGMLGSPFSAISVNAVMIVAAAIVTRYGTATVGHLLSSRRLFGVVPLDPSVRPVARRTIVQEL